LQDEINGLLYGQGPFPQEPRREIAAFQELHDHVGSAVLERSYVRYPRNMLALNPDRGASLAREPSDHILVTQHRRQEKLERDLRIEMNVGRSDDKAHASDAEQLLDAVLTGKDLAFVYARCRPRIALCQWPSAGTSSPSPSAAKISKQMRAGL
jgi:hypothetical protein